MSSTRTRVNFLKGLDSLNRGSLETDVRYSARAENSGCLVSSRTLVPNEDVTDEARLSEADVDDVSLL